MRSAEHVSALRDCCIGSVAIRVAKYELNFEFFYKDSKELWYFLGFIAADGYINDMRVQLTLNEVDLCILEQFQNLIQPSKPIYYKPAVNAYSISIDSMEIASYIKSLFGMTSNKKHEELVFPDVPNEYIADFIRGYFDGDGTLGPTSGKQTVNGEVRRYKGIRVRILGNKQFLTMLNEKFREAYSHKTYSIAKRKGINAHEITYNFSTAEAFLDWIYYDSTLHLPRKQEKYQSLKAS